MRAFDAIDGCRNIELLVLLLNWLFFEHIAEVFQPYVPALRNVTRIRSWERTAGVSVFVYIGRRTLAEFRQKAVSVIKLACDMSIWR